MNKINIEYDRYQLTKDVRVKVKGMPGRRIKKTEVKDPNAWMVCSVENSTDYTPGQYLNKKQVDSLCKANRFHVIISSKKERY